ncbi:MAG: hypothetical protein R2867_44355 [Caldilineaceae bacterium]
MAVAKSKIKTMGFLNWPKRVAMPRLWWFEVGLSRGQAGAVGLHPVVSPA